MRLSEWMSQNGITQLKFAEMIDTSQGYVSDVLSGKKEFSKVIGQRIVKATGGKVSLEEAIFTKKFGKAGNE